MHAALPSPRRRAAEPSPARRAARAARAARIAAIGVVAVAATAAVTATAPATAALDTSATSGTAATAAAADRPEAIVSLGDSFISGEAGRWRGNGNAINLAGDIWGTDRAAYDCNTGYTWCYHEPTRVYGTSYADGCDRSDVAEIDSAPVPITDRVNLACSGAETVNVFPASDGGKDFKGEKPQADQLAAVAKTHTVKMVVLSIGGNDLGFADILTACAKGYLTGDSCKAAQEPIVARALTATRPKVERALKDIRATMSKAGYADGSYRLVVQSYPSPIPTAAQNRYPESGFSRAAEGGCPFLDADSDWAHSSVVPRIAAMVKTAARAEKAEFLDLQKSVYGHEVCAKAGRQAESANDGKDPVQGPVSEWIRFVTSGAGQGILQESLHPDYYGQRAFGSCLGLLWKKEPGDYSCGDVPGKGPSVMELRTV